MVSACRMLAFRAAVLFAVVAAALTSAARARAGGPLDPKDVPPPLRPWIGWALDNRLDATCTSTYAEREEVRCAWPARLDLTLDDRGGRFTQQWHVENAGWVPLPGDDKRWPLAVQRDGARAVVTPREGVPGVDLSAGDHTLAGTFAWDALPESLRVPPETGLLTLTVRRARVAFPVRDAEGTLWLQKAGNAADGDALEIVVARKVTDDVPVFLTTRIELHVSGSNREELLGKALPDGFVPLSLEGPLPARLEPDGRLRVQLRPGIFTMSLVARSIGVVGAIGRPVPDGPWCNGDEVWVFEPKNDIRVVDVTGAPTLDPQQTTVPEEWRRFPAYPMKLGTKLTIDEKRRGDADPPPDQLTLERILWLDFDGNGYSVRDHVTGQIHRDGRLRMAPPMTLGRVSVGGRDMLITRVEGESAAGVEVRQGAIDAVAESRIDGARSNVPAAGWITDFRSVAGSLHLPPGWRLIHASGVDDVPGTWLRRWSLADLFLALVASIATGRLFGRWWGAVACAMFFLVLPEPDAPAWSWLAVLAAEALYRVLPAGRGKVLFSGVRVGALAVVALVAVPFIVQHVREGLYPVLASDSSSELSPLTTLGEGRSAVAKGDHKEEADAPAGSAPAEPLPERKPAPAAAPLARKRAASSPSDEQVYDPTAVAQTGPGLPHWRWTTLELRWTGPVAAGQHVRLYLLAPVVNAWLAVLRAALVLVILLRLTPWAARWLPRAAVVAMVVVPLVTTRSAWADAPAGASTSSGQRERAPEASGTESHPRVSPNDVTLEELADRLTRKPACFPTCASTGRLRLEAHGATLQLRLEIDASAPTGVPLPVAADFAPSQVAVDGRPAKALARSKSGGLVVALGPGAHQVLVTGTLPDRASVSIALPMKPHRVEVDTVGWSVSGVHEDGLADDDIELTRVRPAEAGQADASAENAESIPRFVRIERTLRAGLDWQLDMRVERVAPLHAAIVIEVPLLDGESVTTADVRVASGKALVNMGPEVSTVTWHSVLAQRSPVRLVASRTLAWTEVWKVDVGPVWHASFSGIPPIHPSSDSGTLPEWHPWPGEAVEVDLARPQAVPGRTLTVDESTVEVRPGTRSTDVHATLQVRSSKGADLPVVLPAGAELESLSVDGAAQPLRRQGANVVVPVLPGSHAVALDWRESRGLGVLFRASPVDLGVDSVNASTTIALPNSVWLLATGGPRVGPVVLFWSLLLILAVLAWILGRNPATPLRAVHWLLLGVGLSQLSVWAAAVFVAWLLAVGWRGRSDGATLAPAVFNLRQVALVAWTLGALGILGTALYQGLLGAPDMQVQGNDSTASLLRWFVDRPGPTLPQPWVVTVPILVYRAAMLGWALWIALALLGWLRWGWGAWTTGGTWRSTPKPVRPPPPAPPAPPAPVGGGPV